MKHSNMFHKMPLPASRTKISLLFFGNTLPSTVEVDILPTLLLVIHRLSTTLSATRNSKEYTWEVLPKNHHPKCEATPMDTELHDSHDVHHNSLPVPAMKDNYTRALLLNREPLQEYQGHAHIVCDIVSDVNGQLQFRF